MPERDHGRFGLSNVARVGVFSALAFGVNAPFLVIPSVEIFSLALFLSGIFLGIIDGLAVALISGAIFVLFNPNGPQTVPLVGLAQLFGFILFGLAGGILRPFVLRHYQTGKLIFLLALVGGVLTLWYDFSTNLVFALIFGPFWPTLIGGMGFGIIHIIGNTVIFALSSLIIQRIWKRIGYLLPPLAG
jgi:hypothetical protein